MGPHRHPEMITAEDDTRFMALAYGRCLPLSAGGCGQYLTPDQDKPYHEWLATGKCTACREPAHAAAS